MKRMAVIPARGGSTRLVNKNIYPLGGKPLIRWSTEAVLNSGVFDEVVVSTDSNEIFDAVSDLGVLRHERPQEHSTTKATVLNAMLDLMKHSSGYDMFSYFLPTCPFISPDDIRSGVSMLDEDTDFVVSMTKIPETIQLACVMSGDNVLPVFDNLEAGLTNSKYIKEYYKPSGGFYRGWWDSIQREENFFKGKVRGVIIPKERSIDINDIHDMNVAENILIGQ